MTKDEFNNFLNSIGGLMYVHIGKPDTLVYSFGCKCNDGWLELIAELINELIAAGWTREIRQIKEKFGGLRFYAKGLPENGYEIIASYEKRSYETCERCGSTEKVKLCGDNWVKTLCDKCAGPWLKRSSRFILKS